MLIFQSTRLRLTAWFVFIVALISISFSSLIYRDISRELERGFRVAEYRTQIPLFLELQEARHILFIRIAFINGIIMAATAFAAYFLAGKALRPIEAVVEEQKRFTSDASHELRTPLTSLRTELEVALLDKSFNKETKKLLRSNLEEVTKMQNLTNYLLSLSRYEKNEAKLPKEKLDLATIIQKVTKKFELIARKNNIKIIIEAEKAFIYGNPTSIEELVSIFIDNAIKYSPDGGEIKVITKSVRGHGLLKIIDKGIGIPPEEIPHIFDRFYRSDSSRTKVNSEGFGLGLSIAKSIADIHQAEIKVKSKLGIGTTFAITF